MGDDESVMEWVDMANIACGFHASDPHVMSKTIKLAQHYHTQIGAHPGYQDLVGFGIRTTLLSSSSLSPSLATTPFTLTRPDLINDSISRREP